MKEATERFEDWWNRHFRLKGGMAKPFLEAEKPYKGGVKPDYQDPLKSLKTNVGAVWLWGVLLGPFSLPPLGGLV